MLDLLQTLEQLIVLLSVLFVQVFQLILQNVLLVVFVAISLFAVNWKKLWPVLAAGGWTGVVFLSLIAALVWCFVEPAPYWYRLGGVALVVGGALFCGWLQGVMKFMPEEVDLNPTGEDHGHGHH